jgi:nitrogen fixation NifU-like protein
MNQQATEELQEVYRRRLLEHSRAPHNRRRIDDADRTATGFNPLCGDKISVYLKLQGDNIETATFEGTGCAICIASASMMTNALTGQTLADGKDMVHAVQSMFANKDELKQEALQDIRALEGVRNYPSRVKCALLAWTTTEAALNANNQQVTTES